ncbi:putative cyclin-B3-1 isoform X4 [Aristolochia californica]|uniref:putative cyclin-B3-1 isoform X4 n=1 Tax=Aristolochia californica TaxID=171875 RepID=UPI0035DE4999
MVSSKGKTKDKDLRVDRNPVANKVMDFKVYKEKISGRSRKPLDLGNGTISSKPSMLPRKLGQANVGLENPDSKRNGGKMENVMDKKNGAAGVPKGRSGRKPLADVSNTRISSSRRSIGLPKPVHGKTERGVSLDGRKRQNNSSIGLRFPVRKSSVATSTLSRKSSKGDNETHIPQNDILSSKGTAKFRIYCSNEKINDGTAESSIPLSTRNPEKNVGKVSSTVKVRVQRKVLVEINRRTKNSLSRNHLVDDIKLRNQTGKKERLTGHLLPAKNDKMDGNASFRLPTTGKIIHQYSKPGVTLKSKAMIHNEKKTIANGFTAGSSFMNKLKKEATETRFGNASGNVTTNVFKPNNRCRKSYTSMLVEGSKSSSDCEENFKRRDLPSIDDSRNHLEVAEYVNEIYQYYWTMETHYPLLANYMTVQTELTSTMRATLVNWLIEVHLKFELMEETLFLMVELLDRFLSLFAIKKDEMQLVGITALLLASKYEDYWHPKIGDLISISFDLYTRDHVLAMEKLMLKKLKFRLNFPTPYVFMLRFLKAGLSDKKVEHLAFYLIELCLVQYEALKFKASLLCASAIYIARCTLQLTPRWTELLIEHTHYEESQLKPCADLILGFHKTARKGSLRVTYAKYLVPERDGVAKIKPIDNLPV